MDYEHNLIPQGYQDGLSTPIPEQLSPLRTAIESANNIKDDGGGREALFVDLCLGLELQRAASDSQGQTVLLDTRSSMAHGWIPLSSPLASNSEEIIARRQQIDEELEALQTRMDLLRKERNALCPMYCLSIELLSRIFLHIKDEYELENSDKFGHGYSEWTTVTMVSRHWRDVALGCSLLWNNIVFQPFSPDAKRWLTRAKGTQLSIHAEHITVEDVPLLASLLEDLPRIRRLSIPVSHCSRVWPRIISKLSSSSAPSLEFLHVSDSRLERAPGSTSLTPESLFSGGAPRLRELELSHCNLDAQSPFFQNLTHLSLFHCSPHQPLRAFLAILQRTPHLEVFRMRNGFIPSFLDQGWELSDGKPTILSSIPLPSLRYIAIDSPFSPQGLSLLAHLVVKPDICIQFTDSQDNSPIRSILQVESLIRHKPNSEPSANDTTITCISFTLIPSSQSLLFKAWSAKSGQLLSNICLNLLSSSAEDSITWVAGLRQLPLSSLDTLHINFSIPRDCWLIIFSPLKQLKFISVAGIAGPNMVGFLVQYCLSDDGDNENSIGNPRGFVLPGLTTITFSEVDFGAFSASALVESLVRRKNRGLPFNQINISDCVNVTSSVIEMFAAVGFDVDWDGKEERTDDDVEDPTGPDVVHGA